jgi:hypothetical protein
LQPPAAKDISTHPILAGAHPVVVAGWLIRARRRASRADVREFTITAKPWLATATFDFKTNLLQRPERQEEIGAGTIIHAQKTMMVSIGS